MNITKVPPKPVEPEFELRVTRAELEEIVAGFRVTSWANRRTNTGGAFAALSLNADEANALYRELKDALAK